MTHIPQRLSRATNSPVVNATSSNVRLRPSAGAIQTKRGVHTSLIDAGWDLQPDTSVAEKPAAQRIHAREPRTSIIDAEWDASPESRVAHRSGPHRIDARAPHTSLIDAQWDSWLAEPVGEPSEASPVRARPRQLALVDADAELDPVITWFELDGLECLGLLDGELE